MSAWLSLTAFIIGAIGASSVLLCALRLNKNLLWLERITFIFLLPGIAVAMWLPFAFSTFAPSATMFLQSLAAAPAYLFPVVLNWGRKNAAYKRASAGLGASPQQYFRWVWWPLNRRSIFLSFILFGVILALCFYSVFPI